MQKGLDIWALEFTILLIYTSIHNTLSWLLNPSGLVVKYKKVTYAEKQCAITLHKSLELEIQ